MQYFANRHGRDTKVFISSCGKRRRHKVAYWARAVLAGDAAARLSRDDLAVLSL